jgi:hypothetical protein
MSLRTAVLRGPLRVKPGDTPLSLLGIEQLQLPVGGRGQRTHPAGDLTAAHAYLRSDIAGDYAANTLRCAAKSCCAKKSIAVYGQLQPSGSGSHVVEQYISTLCDGHCTILGRAIR